MDAENDFEILLNISENPRGKGKKAASKTENHGDYHEGFAFSVKKSHEENERKRKREEDSEELKTKYKKQKATIPVIKSKNQKHELNIENANTEDISGTNKIAVSSSNCSGKAKKSKCLTKSRSQSAEQNRLSDEKSQNNSIAQHEDGDILKMSGPSRMMEAGSLSTYEFLGAKAKSIENDAKNLDVNEFKSPRNIFNKKKAFENRDTSESPVCGHQKQYIASLFKSNPEIPHIRLSNFKKREVPVFSKKSFEEMNLHPHLVSCLRSRLGVLTLTEVQENAIPILLEKKDALVKSCTGSGKTLAYSVPIVQQLQSVMPKIQRSDGVYALVIVPTRELAVQSFDCFSTLTKAFTWIVPGYLVGGEKKKSEKARIRKGINILISTPGRLLDHLEHTENLDLKHITWLVIDEADKLLEQGYEEAMLKILNYTNQSVTPQKRQSVLLSATLSKGVEKLAGMSLDNPVYIDISTSNGISLKTEELVIPSQLRQYVIFTPTKLRLVTLSAFLISKCAAGDLKALVFFATQKEVDFFHAVFSRSLKKIMSVKDFHCKFFKLHGSMVQEDRFKVFNSFKEGKNGILFCTDVAARGLDLPCVDWIIQYSAPSSPENYVHRVGRTARIGKEGQSLLFLIPSEVKFIDMLRGYKIHLEEMAMKDLLVSLLLICDVLQKDSRQNWRSKTVEEHATALHTEYENLVYSDTSVHDSARDAFMSYVQAYSSYPKAMRTVIPFKMLHLGHVAKSFCLREAPSALGCRFAKPARSQFSTSRRWSHKPFQYKHDSRHTDKQNRETNYKVKSTVLSEFSSGFDEIKKMVHRTPVRKKKF